MPSVSVVIPTRNEAENIVRVIGEVRKASPDYNIIVVDDSEDNRLTRMLAVTGAVVGAVVGALGGTMVGIMQGFVLRRRISWLVWWVLASIVSWAVAGSLCSAAAITVPMGGLVAWALAGTLGGALSGIAQCFVLKRQISRAGWWALVSTLGWAAAFLLFAGAVVGILGGAITGIV